MRSSRVFSFVTGAALLAACGGDSNGPSNAAPTAAFNDPTCTQLTCNFSGTPSTDGDGTVTGYAWDFGDATSGQNTATTKDASHTFSAASTYTVKLTVTDNDGAQGTVTKSVTVSAPAPGTPTAAFTVTCSATDCTVVDGSTDAAPGTVTGWHWDFGDGGTSDAQNPPAHHYDVTAATPFTITLTVTDDDGLTGSVSHDVSVAPAAGLTCSGEACALLLPQASTVVVTLVSHDCEVHGNTFVLTAPVEETLFTDGCYNPVAPDPLASHPLQGGAAFDANTELSAEVRSGFSGTTTPQLRVSGDYASGWTLEYDDGFVGTGEPDFNDLVITVKATPVGP